MAMARFSFSLACPVKSASRAGRRLTSNWRSSSRAEGETIPFSRMGDRTFSLPYQLKRPAEELLEAVDGPLALALRTAASALARVQPRLTKALSTS